MVISIYKSDFSCQFPIFKVYQNRICKDLTKESRIDYWHTAFLSIKDNFIVGDGTGTYSLFSIKYKVNLGVNTSYADNSYLHLIS